MPTSQSLRRQFGAIIREVRVGRNMTQRQFAELLKRTERYVSGIERGEYNLSLDQVEQLANELGIVVRLSVEQLEEAVPTGGTESSAAPEVTPSA
ncbi:helix-turn-helix domain-containing protein [Leucobacter sp. HY1910]